MSVPANMTQEPLSGDTIEASRVREARDQVSPYRWVAGLDRSVSGTSLTLLASPAWTVVAAGNLWKRADTEANHAETLTDDDTNYVFFAGSNANIEVNTTGTPTDPDSVPLYRITLVGGSVTENVDLRVTDFVFPDVVKAEGGFDADNQTIDNVATATKSHQAVNLGQLAGSKSMVVSQYGQEQSNNSWSQSITRYLNPWFVSYPGATPLAQYSSATESDVQVVAPFPFTLRNLYNRLILSELSTGTITYTIRKNGADTALTVTMTGNTVPTIFSDTSNEATFAQGDLISIKAQSSAWGAGGRDASWVSSMEMEAT